MNYKKLDIVEDFFLKSDPYVVWDSLFGCSPNDTDIVSGINSSASVALEESLLSFEKVIDASLLGADFQIEIPVNKRNINLLRRKLMSAAILQLSANKSKSKVVTDYVNYEKPGIVLFLGEISNSTKFLEALGCGVLNKFMGHTDKTNTFSPLFVSDGEPSCEIETWNKEQVKNIFSLILNEHIYKIVTQNEFDVLNLGVSNEVLDFSPFISFSDFDDRSRFNEIIKHVRKLVDEGEDIHDAIMRAPFKTTLIQNISYRLVQQFDMLVLQYGFKKVRDGKYRVSYQDPEDLKPILYRLLGDSQFFLSGIMKKEYVKSVKIFLPLGENIPVLAFVSADSLAASQFKEFFGEADLVIGLPEAQEMENLFDLDIGNCVLLDENTIFNTKYVLEEMKEIFGEFEFKEQG